MIRLLQDSIICFQLRRPHQCTNGVFNRDAFDMSRISLSMGNLKNSDETEQVWVSQKVQALLTPTYTRSIINWIYAFSSVDEFLKEKWFKPTIEIL